MAKERKMMSESEKKRLRLGVSQRLKIPNLSAVRPLRMDLQSDSDSLSYLAFEHRSYAETHTHLKLAS